MLLSPPFTPVLRSADSLIRSITLRYHSYDAALVLNDILLPLQAAKRTPHRGCEISTLVSCRRKGLRSSSCNYARNEQPRGKGECAHLHIYAHFQSWMKWTNNKDLDDIIRCTNKYVAFDLYRDNNMQINGTVEYPFCSGWVIRNEIWIRYMYFYYRKHFE